MSWSHEYQPETATHHQAATGWRGADAAPDRPIVILFLGATPETKVRLKLDQEVKAIQQKLRELEAGHRLVLRQEWAVRPSELQGHLLRYQPDIVHFSGHGSTTGELVFQGEPRGEQPVAIEALAHLFEILEGRVRSVVLNACYSEVQADALRRHVDCVIGMTSTIVDAAAIAFSSSLYRALGSGETMRKAFELGCNQIEIEGHKGADRPVLLCKPGSDAREVDYSRAAALWRAAEDTARENVARVRARITASDWLTGDARTYVARAVEKDIARFLDSDSQTMLILGQSGVGKTTLVTRLVTQWDDAGALCYLVNAGDIPTELERRNRYLGTVLAGHHAVDPDAALPAIARAAAQRGRRVIIIVDAVNEFDERTRDDTLFERLDELSLQARSEQLDALKYIITSRPEAWRRSREQNRVSHGNSAGAYFATHGVIEHSLERFTPAEASEAYAKYSEVFRVRTPWAELSTATRILFQDPLLLAIACKCFQSRQVPGELETNDLFRAYLDYLRRGPDGTEWINTIKSIVRRMFASDDSAVIERDAIPYDHRLRERDPDLYEVLAPEPQNTLGARLRTAGVLRDTKEKIRFTYDRFAEYLLSEELLERTKGGRELAGLRANLPGSVRMITVFGALRRTLGSLRTRVANYPNLVRALAGDERGITLVASVLAAIAMDRELASFGDRLVHELLTKLARSNDRAPSSAQRRFPLMDAVHRVLLDDEYRYWLADRDPGTRARHLATLYPWFAWGMRHRSELTSTAAVQYLFFLWQEQARGREHAFAILTDLTARMRSFTRMILTGGSRRFLKSVTGLFVLLLAEAPRDADIAALVPFAKDLVKRLRPHRSLVLRAARLFVNSLGDLMARLLGALLDAVLKGNPNPANFRSLRHLLTDPGARRDALALLGSFRTEAGFDPTPDQLAALGASHNGYILLFLGFALSVVWERAVRAGRAADARAQLERIEALYRTNLPTAQYASLLALYHINYFGEFGNHETITLFGRLVDEVLQVQQGRFRLGPDEYSFNVVGTYGRAVRRHSDKLLPATAIAADPALKYVIDALEAAKLLPDPRAAFDQYTYLCKAIGLLGVLVDPSDVFEVFTHVFIDLGRAQPLARQKKRPRAPLPFDGQNSEAVLALIVSSLASIRVIYREKVDRYLLDLDIEELYSQVTTSNQAAFSMPEFFSWMSEQLVFRMLTRWYPVIGTAFLDGLEDGVRQSTNIACARAAAHHVVLHLGELCGVRR